MPRPRNFWDVLGQSAGYAGESFGDALLQRQAYNEREDERSANEDYRNRLMDFREQQHADQIRQWEVEGQNRLLGLNAGPVNYKVGQPDMPGNFEEAATQYLMQGGSPDDPLYRNLLQAESAFNPPSGSNKLQAPPNFVQEFTDDIAEQQADYDAEVQRVARMGDISRGGQYVRPEVTVSPPDVQSMWWRKYMPQITAAGLNADSIRAILAPAYPQLRADRRTGADAEPANPETQMYAPATNNLLQQGVFDAMGLPQQPADTGLSEEEQRRLEYLMSLEGE